MKKFMNFAFISLLATSVVLVGCGEDDEDEEPEVVTCTPESAGDNGAAGSIDLNFSDEGTVFDPFGERAIEVVDNPDLEGNESCKVLQWTATASPCETWGGIGWRIGTTNDFGSGAPLNFDNMGSTFTLDVWGPAGTVVNLRLERLGFPDVDPVQEIAQTKSTEGWETLTFSFVAQDADDSGSTDTYESIIMYLNKDACPDSDQTFYVDNLVQS